MKVSGQIPEILGRDGLELIRPHRKDFYQYFRSLFHGMHKPESQVKIFSGAEHAVVGPDSGVILSH